MCDNSRPKTEEERYEEYYEKHYDELYEEAQIAFYETGANYENVDEEMWIESWIEARVESILKERKKGIYTVATVFLCLINHSED